jgi:fucose permease
MNWLHASWGVGAAVAPAVVATTLHAGRTWRSAYLGLAVAELALGGAFLLTRRAWSSVPAPAPEHAAVERGRWSAAHTRRVLLFFFYTGVESGVGLWSASVLVSTRGATPARAGVAVALYWGGLTIGRLVFGLLVPRLGEARVLRAALACALVLLVTLAVPGTPLLVAQLGLAALGFSLGPVFPLLMHETPRRFPGADGVRLVGYQIAAASAGVATLPWVLGAAGRALAPGVIPLLAAALFSAALVLARAR